MKFDWEVSRENIVTVARGLGELVDSVVFVGGATLGFYVDNSPDMLRDIKGSEDVDIVVEVMSRLAYAKLEDRLREKAFANDNSQGAPICRWVFAGVKVDVIPTDPKLLTFSNRWYKDGVREAIRVEIVKGTEVRIMPAAYFVACKIEAFKGRGKKSGEYMFSRDLEDIVTLFDGRESLVTEIAAAQGKVGDYLRAEIAALLTDAEFIAAGSAFIPAGSRQADRIRRAFSKMQTTCTSGQ